MSRLLVVLYPNQHLEAMGPGTVFLSIEEAAVDALTYAYLRASEKNDTERMRGGTIYSVDTGYSYGEFQVASRLNPGKITYPLKPQDVARFHVYPRFTFKSMYPWVSRRERASWSDRHSVVVTDPLQRPLFILHPSLIVREHHGRNHGAIEVANLRRTKRAILVAGGGVDGLKALQLEGHDLYIREGCSRCHPPMVRPLRAETERYGHYPVAGESAYDHHFLWESKRTGPDLARSARRYSDNWHRTHLVDPQSVVPESKMPGFPWLAENTLNRDDAAAKARALGVVGVPYEDVDIEGAQQPVASKTEIDAVIAYLQQLGSHLQ
jgi:cytochrome c oxidase cbb3-type subunit 2